MTVLEFPPESHHGDRQTNLLDIKGDGSALSRPAYTLVGGTSIALAWRPCIDRTQGLLLISALSVYVTLTGLFLLPPAQMGGQP
jgi:hypothetical protein